MRRLTRATLVVGTMLAAASATADAVKTADYEFAYSYPAAAARYPALKRWLEADRAAMRASLAHDTAAERREAKKGGYDFRPYDIDKAWQVVTETPRFLSLSAQFYAYSGGAHGNTASIGLLWDKAAGKRLAPRDLFVSPAAIQAAIGAAYCRALDTEREEKRSEPVKRGEWPNQCVKVSETTILLGSTNHQRFNRIGLIADQYVAGSYAEGPYEVTLPITPTLLAAVKPAYRAAFAVR